MPSEALRAPLEAESFTEDTKRMRIQPGEVYRIQWPYDVALEKEPYAIVVSEESFNDQYVVVVPLFTANLTDSAARLVLPEEVIGRRAVAHTDKLTRLPVANIKALESGPVGTIEEEVFFDLNLAVGKAVGAHFFPGEFEAGWKPPGSKRPERGSIWQAFWHDSKQTARPGLVMSDSSDTNDHVILMPLTSQPLEKKPILPYHVDLGEYVAQADQVEVVRTQQLREYDDRVDRSKFEAACRAIAHVIGAEL